MILPTPPALLVNDGALTLIGVASGSVPAAAVIVDGIALSPTGELYVVFV